MTEEGDDASMINESFVAGDERALAEIYARWSSLVYSVALRSLGDVPDAEEITRRVFTEAWTSRHAFDPTRVKLPAWLIGITRSKIADAPVSSRRGRWGTTSTPTLTRLQSDPANVAEQLMLADEISRLAPVPQRVIRLALCDDLTHDQIAERTGLPAAFVKSQIRCGLLELQERLAVLRDAH